MADQVNPIGNLTASAPAIALQVAAPQAPKAKSVNLQEAADQVTLSPSAAPAASEVPRTNAPSLEDAARTLRQFLNDLPSDLQFEQDEDTGLVYFKVVNPLTKEVIRQVPAEEVLALARKLKELSGTGKNAPGVLLDEKG